MVTRRVRRRAVLLVAALAVTGCGASGPTAAPVDLPTGSEPDIPQPSTSSAPTAVPEPSPPQALPAASLPAEPVRVDVPSIGVGSDLVDLGLAADGAMEVPADFGLAGWFTGGGRPGGRGPVVIAGHVDSRDGPAVFYRLRDLVVGDTVDVTSADGAVTTYRVDAVEAHPKDDFPTAAVFGATPDDQLRLVTCDGAFDRSERSYVDNLVVFAGAVA